MALRMAVSFPASLATCKKRNRSAFPTAVSLFLVDPKRIESSTSLRLFMPPLRRAPRGSGDGNELLLFSRYLQKKKPQCFSHCGFSLFGGPEGDRTLDLCVANAALSQLSYGPVCNSDILTVFQ